MLTDSDLGAGPKVMAMFGFFKGCGDITSPADGGPEKPAAYLRPKTHSF